MARFSNPLLFWILLAGCLLWLPVPGQAATASTGGILEKARAEGRLTPEEVLAIEGRLEQVRNLDLPPAPFAAKVDEGLAKRMGGQAIISALDSLRDDYAFARYALEHGGSTPAPEDIVQTGDSLRLGLSRSELAEMAEQGASSAMLATAARARAYLNAIGYPSTLSTDILRQGLSSGSLTPGWTQLFRVVQRAREAGMSDTSVSEAALRTLSEGGGPGELLQELGFTDRDIRQVPGSQKK